MSLANLLDEAGLTGRGGAAFATGIKVRAAHESGATGGSSRTTCPP